MTKPKENWEKEFDRRFVVLYNYVAVDVKKSVKCFISKLLSSQRTQLLKEIIKEIGKMKQDTSTKVEDTDVLVSNIQYNNILSEVIELIKNHD